MRRVTATLERYAARARALGAERLLAVATSAVRDAANRDDFLARVAATGFEPRLSRGDEEAATTFAGVCSRAPGEAAVPADGTLVVDVGGGSTELVLGDGRRRRLVALAAGRLRAHDRALPGRGRRRRAPTSRPARRRRGAAAASCPTTSSQATRRAIAVAGTATTLAAIAHGGYDPEAVHGARITRAQTREIAGAARRR